MPDPKTSDRPESAPGEPQVLPDVATSPHPIGHDSAPTGDLTQTGGPLQEGMPEIQAVARKVGGFKRLAEIAQQLDRAEPGK